MDNTAAELPLFDRLQGWFADDKNKKQLLWITIAVIVAAALATLFLLKQKRVELSASEDLAKVQASLMTPGAKRDETAEAYLKVASEHAGTLAGARAAIQAAMVNFTGGKFAEALEQFQKFNREYPDSQLRPTALLGIAASTEALGKTDEAITAYKTLVDQRPTDPVATQARFSLARLYEGQGKLDLALPLYETVAQDPNSTIGNESGLKAEELRRKLPAAPKTAAVTNAPTSSVPVLTTQPSTTK